MIKIFSIIIGIILPVKSIACMCDYSKKHGELLSEELNNSEIVFIGIVTETDENRFTFKIEELLIGTVKDSLIHGIDIGMGCSTTPKNISERWIVYSNVSEGLISLGICGLSRSFENPYYPSIYSIPPPPKKNSREIDVYINEANFKIKALIELKQEIDFLKRMKGQND